MGGMGWRVWEGPFCSRLSLCVCWSPGRGPSLPTSAYTMRFSLIATRPGGCPPGCSPSSSLSPTVDAAWSSSAFVPLACAFKHFPMMPLVSITHSAPQAFKCHKQDKPHCVANLCLSLLFGPCECGKSLTLPPHFARSSLFAGPQGCPSEAASQAWC